MLITVESDLVDGLRAGRENAFVAFRVEFAISFYHYFRHHGLSEADAMELTETCLTDIPLKVRDHFPEGHPSFAAWVNLLKNRACHDWWRKKKRIQMVDLSPDLTAPDDDDSAMTAAEQAAAEAIAELDPIDREILAMRYGGQVQPSFKEIASDLTQIHKTEFRDDRVRQRHTRALSRLETRLRADARLTSVARPSL
jgi:DNA-directed RNA polymerase specialized sigma24 family protein